MAVANLDQSLASQQEYVRPELEDLALSSSKTWKKFEKNTQVKAVSSRPARIPTMPSTGGKPRVGNMDGADMGIGSGPTEVPGQLTSVCYLMAFSYTKQAEYSTDSDEKAIENFATLTRSIAPKKFADFMDTLCQTSGNNQLDTIVALVQQAGLTVGLQVGNANLFLDDQDIDIAVAGGTVTVTVQSSDINSNVLWLTAPAPASVAAAQPIYVNGASQQANTGLAGMRTYQVGTNTGNWMTVQRSAWPGKYITPNIPVNGALTPQIVRAVEAQMELAKGIEDDGIDDVFGHCNLDVRNAWEQNALLVQHIDMAQLKGDASVDMLKRKTPGQIGGHPMLVNPRALFGYLDFLKMKNLFRIEVKPVDFYDVGGQTLFPIYGQSGGLASALVFYMVWEGQLGIVQTRENSFLTGITAPKGLFNSSAS